MSARAIALLAASLLAGCHDIDRGECLAGHKVAAWRQLVPMRVGNVTIFNTIHHPERFACDQWEYPGGRSVEGAPQ